MRLDADTVKADARGKWPSILQTLGIDKAYLTNRPGACPICQEGKDRYRFDDKEGKGTWFCSQCPKQSGDGISLLMAVKGWRFPEALEEVAKLTGTAQPVKVRVGPSEAEVKAEANRIWLAGMDFARVPDVADWWRRRLGYVPALTDLRGAPALKCPGAGVYAAQLALVRGVDGKPVNLHRTFLAEGGYKADCGEPRRVMALTLPKGCAVRLAAYTDVLGVAEGIETAAAAMELFKVPVWAALNTTNLEGWEPPEGVRVIVFGDNDANFAGQKAAFILAHRLRVKKLDVEVKIPPAPGMDWNDVWVARVNQPAAANTIAA